MLDPFDTVGGWWFGSEVEIGFEDTQVFRPDLAGWRRDRLAEPPADVPMTVRPDWICEILSAASSKRDRIYKKRAYHRHGVGHYWIVDPAEEMLVALRWSPDGYQDVASGDGFETVRAGPFGSIALRIGELFSEPS